MKAILEFMKRNYKILMFVAVLAVALLSFIPGKKESDPDKDKLLLELITFVIEKGHYDPAAINDDFSKGVYKDYIEGLDPSKRFFLQSDIDEFAKYETQIDDMINTQDLTFFDLTYTKLIQRLKESEDIYKDILDKPFDYSIDETFDADYEHKPYAKSKDELKLRWEKQLKLSVLSSITDKQKVQEKNLETYNKKSAEEKEKADKPEMKSFEELEKEARESSRKSLDQYFEFIDDLTRDEWFSIYLNSIVERFDPHTFYFAPDDKEKFDTSMRGSIEGIGARLQKKSDYVEISELIPGGPAWRGKELEQGDLIMKVAQGEEEPVDIAGMRLDDVVKKIKGPKGTEVRLTVKKVDGSIDVIPIVREVVEIEETYAKSSVVEKDGKKYGIINLPKFYIDFENKDNRDAAKDVKQEVIRLREYGVDGIVIDLRNNGGGSLRTVVDMTGLFVPEGPVVQVKSSNKNKEVLEDKGTKVEWDGPLVVLVNNFSASASEIFAAAIQDYNRGLILGSRHTYGKGTVQNVIDLNQFVRGNSMGDLGALKTTTQKFYRINGGSTQREGVYSDIVMPDRYAYLQMGERDSETAMPWDKIDAASFKPFKSNYDLVIAKSNDRISKNDQFKLIDENAKWIDAKKDDNQFDLNIDKFKAELKKTEDITKKFKAISDYKNGLEFKPLPYEQAIFDKDPAFAEKKEIWYESLAKDVYVEEAINVLGDMQDKSAKTAFTLNKKEKPIKTR
ncbi:carboxy terminal-processing peptidase [Flavobacterium beibuense]|uniref:carboxy terminal-processing peptidase n=1 Tax=Flavobacterium beibuense TaxID=657326 RepID=UPI003A8FB6EB